MFNPEYDPFEALQQLQVAVMSHDHAVDELEGHYKTQAQLMEMMANQIKHLTNAVIGLQAQNQALFQRISMLENNLD